MTTDFDNAAPPVDNRFAKVRFEAAVGQIFWFNGFDANGQAVPVPLKLERIRTRSSPPGFEQFAALFVGPAGQALGQGNYPASSDGFGSENLFIVPIGLADDGGRLYELVVARRAQHG